MAPRRTRALAPSTPAGRTATTALLPAACLRNSLRLMFLIIVAILGMMFSCQNQFADSDYVRALARALRQRSCRGPQINSSNSSPGQAFTQEQTKKITTEDSCETCCHAKN